MVEHGLYNDALPIKAYYFTSCYRYEKPQAGRLREFHQFGVEVFGAGAPSADAEVICLAKSVFDLLGVRDLSLEINSIGCPECRAKKYHKALRGIFPGLQRPALRHLPGQAGAESHADFWTAKARCALKSPRAPW